MDSHARIDQYDLVEIVQVPEVYQGVMDIGDIGVVVEKLDEENFRVECLRPGGSSKWLETLHIHSIRLKSQDPYRAWISRSFVDSRSMMRRSVVLGSVIGAGVGALTGSGLGAITRSFSGVLIGLLIGLVLGGITGAITAALTVKTAGTTGGVGAGYFTGLLFGGAFGLLIGALIPTSLRMRAQTEGMPVLDALVMGRFETAILIGFALSVLATIVGVWIGGRNLVPRDLKNEQ